MSDQPTKRHDRSDDQAILNSAEIPSAAPTAGHSEIQQRKPGFQPGVSGNPAGRKPGSRNRATLLRDAYIAELAKDCKAGKLTNAEAIAKRVTNDALTAKPGTRVLAAKELADRTEGKPMQAFQIVQTMDGETARRLADMAERLFGGIPGGIPPAFHPAEMAHKRLPEGSAQD